MLFTLFLLPHFGVGALQPRPPEPYQLWHLAPQGALGLLHGPGIGESAHWSSSPDTCLQVCSSLPAPDPPGPLAAPSCLNHHTSSPELMLPPNLYLPLRGCGTTPLTNTLLLPPVTPHPSAALSLRSRAVAPVLPPDFGMNYYNISRDIRKSIYTFCDNVYLKIKRDTYTVFWNSVINYSDDISSSPLYPLFLPTNPPTNQFLPTNPPTNQQNLCKKSSQPGVEPARLGALCSWSLAHATQLAHCSAPREFRHTCFKPHHLGITPPTSESSKPLTNTDDISSSPLYLLFPPTNPPTNQFLPTNPPTNQLNFCKKSSQPGVEPARLGALCSWSLAHATQLAHCSAPREFRHTSFKPHHLEITPPTSESSQPLANSTMLLILALVTVVFTLGDSQARDDDTDFGDECAEDPLTPTRSSQGLLQRMINVFTPARPQDSSVPFGGSPPDETLAPQYPPSTFPLPDETLQDEHQSQGAPAPPGETPQKYPLHVEEQFSAISINQSPSLRELHKTKSRHLSLTPNSHLQLNHRRSSSTSSADLLVRLSTPTGTPVSTRTRQSSESCRHLQIQKTGLFAVLDEDFHDISYQQDLCHKPTEGQGLIHYSLPQETDNLNRILKYMETDQPLHLFLQGPTARVLVIPKSRFVKKNRPVAAEITMVNNSRLTLHPDLSSISLISVWVNPSNKGTPCTLLMSPSTACIGPDLATNRAADITHQPKEDQPPSTSNIPTSIHKPKDLASSTDVDTPSASSLPPAPPHVTVTDPDNQVVLPGPGSSPRSTDDLASEQDHLDQIDDLLKKETTLDKHPSLLPIALNLSTCQETPDHLITPQGSCTSPDLFHEATPIPPTLCNALVSEIISSQPGKEVDKYLKLLHLPCTNKTKVGKKRQALTSACTKGGLLPLELIKFLIGKTCDASVKNELKRLRIPLQPLSSAKMRKQYLIDIVSASRRYEPTSIVPSLDDKDQPLPALLHSESDSSSAKANSDSDSEPPSPSKLKSSPIPAIQVTSKSIPSPAPKLRVKPKGTSKRTKKAVMPKPMSPSPQDLLQVINAIKLLESSIVEMKGQLQRQESTVNLCLSGPEKKNKPDTPDISAKLDAVLALLEKQDKLPQNYTHTYSQTEGIEFASLPDTSDNSRKPHQSSINTQTEAIESAPPPHLKPTPLPTALTPAVQPAPTPSAQLTTSNRSLATSTSQPSISTSQSSVNCLIPKVSGMINPFSVPPSQDIHLTLPHPLGPASQPTPTARPLSNSTQTTGINLSSNWLPGSNDSAWQGFQPRPSVSVFQPKAQLHTSKASDMINPFSVPPPKACDMINPFSVPPSQASEHMAPLQSTALAAQPAPTAQPLSSQVQTTTQPGFDLNPFSSWFSGPIGTAWQISQHAPPIHQFSTVISTTQAGTLARPGVQFHPPQHHPTPCDPLNMNPLSIQTETAWPYLHKSRDSVKTTTPKNMAALFPKAWDPTPPQPASVPKWSAQSSSSQPKPTPPTPPRADPRQRASPPKQHRPVKRYCAPTKPKILFLRDDVLKDFHGDKFGASLAPSAINVVSIRQSLSDLQRINKNAAGVDAFVIQIGTNDLKNDPADSVIHLLKQLIAQLRVSAPQAKIIVCPPVIRTGQLLRTKFSEYRSLLDDLMQDLKKEDPNIIYVHNRVLFDTTDATTYVNDDAMGIGLTYRGKSRLLGCIKQAIFFAFGLPPPPRRTPQ